MAPFHADIKFVNYLIGSKEYKDAIVVLTKQQGVRLSQLQKDTLNYYLGWSHYSIKSLDSSSAYFNKVQNG